MSGLCMALVLGCIVVAIEIAAGIAELRRSLYLLACFLLGWYATDIVAWLKGVLR